MSHTEEWLANHCQQISPDLGAALAPARYYLYEWADHWIECPGADRLRVGSEFVKPVTGDLFRLRFENQLGLTQVQPYAGLQPLEPPVCVEVISPKFPTPAKHVAFFRTLVNDLFARAARLPFTLSSQTGRGVTEALQPPTPLFTLHFLCQYAPALRTALAIIQASPHRCLTEQPEFVPLAQATEADADVLISILHSPDEWTRAQGFPLAARLKGYAPTRVWQRLTEETFDTPENRFVLAFLHQLLAAADALPAQPWWGNVREYRQAVVREVGNLLHQVIAHPIFSEVGPLQHLPLSSRVLLQRDGYRDVLDLWRTFHHARRPLFAPLQQAMDVRDVAALYEMWAFFALIDGIRMETDQSPVIDLRLSDERGVGWQAEARFGPIGRLVYNHTTTGYSGPLRPDFSWFQEGELDSVLDAKFRLDRPPAEGLEDDQTPEAMARRADLYKMHTYRDALDVRSAVCVYPGDIAAFYDHSRKPTPNVTLKELLFGGLAGIGALPMKPGSD